MQINFALDYLQGMVTGHFLKDAGCWLLPHLAPQEAFKTINKDSSSMVKLASKEALIS